MFRGNFCFAYVPVFLVLELSTYFISHVIELSVFQPQGDLRPRCVCTRGC